MAAAPPNPVYRHQQPVCVCGISTQRQQTEAAASSSQISGDWGQIFSCSQKKQAFLYCKVLLTWDISGTASSEALFLLIGDLKKEVSTRCKQKWTPNLLKDHGWCLWLVRGTCSTISLMSWWFTSVTTWTATHCSSLAGGVKNIVCTLHKYNKGRHHTKMIVFFWALHYPPFSGNARKKPTFLMISSPSVKCALTKRAA